jgi:hypothetical protein
MSPLKVGMYVGFQNLSFEYMLQAKVAKLQDFLGEVDNPNPGKQQVSNSRLFGNV